MQENLKDILEKNISPYFLKIYEPYIEQNIKEFSGGNVSEYIIKKAKQLIAANQELNKEFSTRAIEYNEANDLSKQKTLLELSKFLGSNEQQLDEERKAFVRWFDFSVLQERLEERNAIFKKKICFLIRQYKYAATKDFCNLDFLLESIKNNRFTLAALETLIFLIKENIVVLKESFVTDIVKLIHKQNDIWIIVGYLEILAILDQEKFVQYFEKLFKENSYLDKKDSIFLKSGIIELLKYLPNNKLLVELALKDNSAYVRQNVCKYMRSSNALEFEILKNIILYDPDKAVQAYALITFSEKIIREQNIDRFINIVEEIINSETIMDIFLLKTLLNSFKTVMSGFVTINIKSYVILSSLLVKITTGDFSLIIKKHACDIHLEIAMITNKKLLDCKIKLENIIKNLPIASKTVILDFDINSLILEEIGKILYVIANNDFEIEFWQNQGSYIIQRGHKKKFKFWRLLYEFFTPSTEKRQDISHIIATSYKGRHLILPKMAELSDTGVPGESLYIQNEGPRRFLPPLDYCLAIIKNKQEKYIYSSEGIITITPPSNLINKIYAYLKLSINFKSIADLRHLPQNNISESDSYINILRKVGIEINFTEDKNIKACNETKQFFTSFSIIPFFNNFSALDYFSSPSENNLLSLIIFIGLVIIGLSYKRIKDYKAYKKMRINLPLVIGGWGTRGKTGSERLKAALFTSLGFKVISKTTGSKAAMLISGPQGKLYELPLIRPYDTHTITEQKEITIFASLYGSEVFLWECMGLNPEYANIMQVDWMRDDISTITNTYPDHEDTQGPSGQDVAISIANFIYKNSYLLTSEESMLPILQEKARTEGAMIENISSNEAGLITDDILASFSYHEHPSNIALILLLAKKLALNENIALKAMVDNTIPDIGALQYFTPCKIYGRELHFINGMSANEVVGAVNNWFSLGFNKLSISKEPNIYISALVNNRDDRQKRSIAFATILALEFSVDKYYLIGTNLIGFKKSILKQWEQYLNNLIHRMRGGDRVTLLGEVASKLRICKSLYEKNKMLDSIKFVGNSAIIQQAISCKQQIEKNYRHYIELKLKLENDDFPEQEINKFLSDVFLKKITIIEENCNQPDEILNKIITSTPPGFINKIVGMQNIKSPGGEFIAAWNDYEQCYDVCNYLKKNKKVEEQLKILTSFSEFNILCHEYVKDTIIMFKNSKSSQEYNEIIEQIEIILDKSGNNSSEKKKPNIIRLLKLYQDYKNIKKAKLIYKDLHNKNISLQRASLELNKII